MQSLTTIDQICNAQYKTDNIRNMSVIAHVDHGKSTLTDSLLARAGIIPEAKAGDARTTDGRQDEKDRGITIKSTGVSLFYKTNIIDEEKEPQDYLVNLIDSPGHVDFSSEVTAALRVTDGALVVVDYIEGASVQTETVLRQALGEKIKPILMINKIDRGIMEQQVDGETMYTRMVKVIEDINVIISTYDTPEMGENQLDPRAGTVAMGSALFGWGFTITHFAKVYSKKLGISKDKMMEKLWGENYWNGSKKVWQNYPEAEDGTKLKRAFVEFIMSPIIRLCRATISGDMDKVNGMLKNLGIVLKQEELELKGKNLMKNIFQKWINAADALLEMIVLKLPSPVQAQQYRAAYLYEGPQDDATCKAIRECDKDGPLCIFISKMIPARGGRFYAFGRVFSGTVKAGAKVRVQGPNYIPGKKDDLNIATVQGTVIMMAGKEFSALEVPCGNTVGLVGIDKYLMKQGTITSDENAHNIRVMKYSVSPVVRVSVEVKNAVDLPKLVNGLKLLAKSDPLVQVTTEETGEHVIAGCGDLHVEICIKDLIDDFAKCEIKVGNPVVTYQETIQDESSKVCLAKSQNNHNRIFLSGAPLQDELSIAIEKERIGPKNDLKERAKILSEEFEWDKNEALKIWCFGPDTTGPNMLTDITKQVDFLHEIRDSVETAFNFATQSGALCDENMRGCRFNINDVKLHTDAIHRGGGQIIPAFKKAMFGTQLSSSPGLQEPIFLVEMQTPGECIGKIYTTITQRRGIVIGEEPLPGTALSIVKAYLPVSESFGFTSFLREQTSGKAFPQCSFDHWQLLKGDTLEIGSDSNILVESIRKRKGLKPGIPAADSFLSKL